MCWCGAYKSKQSAERRFKNTDYSNICLFYSILRLDGDIHQIHKDENVTLCKMTNKPDSHKVGAALHAAS